MWKDISPFRWTLILVVGGYVLVAPWFLTGVSAFLAVLAGMAVCLFLVVDRLSEFSIGPLKATIREARDTLQDTRKLATAIATISLESLMAGNFGLQDGLSVRRRFTMHDRIIEFLRSLHVDESEIDQAEKKWRDGIGYMFMNQINHVFELRKERNQINPDAPRFQERQDVMNRLLKKGDFKTWSAPTSEEVRTEILSAGFAIDPTVEDLLTRYETFRETGKLPNEDEFLKFYDRI